MSACLQQPKDQGCNVTVPHAINIDASINSFPPVFYSISIEHVISVMESSAHVLSVYMGVTTQHYQ